MLLQMRKVEDFEAVMAHLAGEEGWVFRDGDDEIAAEGVFDKDTFAPALLRLAELEVAGRGLPISLGMTFEPREDALHGVSVAFDPDASLMAAMWRLTLAAHIVDQLPRIGDAKDLGLLHQVFVAQPALSP